MQGLVLLTAGDDEQHHLLLDLAVQQGIVPCTVVALNSDEPELVYWALGLLHEIALKQGNVLLHTRDSTPVFNTHCTHCSLRAIHLQRKDTLLRCAPKPDLRAWVACLTTVAIEQIKSATLLVYNLYKALSSSDAASQKIVLRIIGFLAIKVRGTPSWVPIAYNAGLAPHFRSTLWLQRS